MPHRPNQTSFTKKRPGPGRPRQTPQERQRKKAEMLAVRELAYDLKAELAKTLPQTVAVLKAAIRKKTGASGTQLRAVEVVHDRLYGRPPQAITGPQGGPLLVSFSQIVGAVDGGKHEKL